MEGGGVDVERERQIGKERENVWRDMVKDIAEEKY
jgi:hypothetical protein